MTAADRVRDDVARALHEVAFGAGIDGALGHMADGISQEWADAVLAVPRLAALLDLAEHLDGLMTRTLHEQECFTPKRGLLRKPCRCEVMRDALKAARAAWKDQP